MSDHTNPNFKMVEFEVLGAINNGDGSATIYAQMIDPALPKSHRALPSGFYGSADLPGMHDILDPTGVKPIDEESTLYTFDLTAPKLRGDLWNVEEWAPLGLKIIAEAVSTEETFERLPEEATLITIALDETTMGPNGIDVIQTHEILQSTAAIQAVRTVKSRTPEFG